MISPSSFTGDFLQSFIEAVAFDLGCILEEEIYTALKEVVSKDDIRAALEKLESYYLKRNGGLKFIQTQEGWQFVAVFNKGISLGIEKDKLGGELLKRECQVLAILLEKGPQTQKDIDYILGDDCSHFVSSLREKGFVVKNNGGWDLSTLFFIKLKINNKKELLEKIGNRKKIKEEDVFFEDFFKKEDISSFF